MIKQILLHKKIALFLALCEREWLVYKRRLVGLIISFLIVQPLTFIFVQGYSRPIMYFGSIAGRPAAMIVAGTLLMMFIHRTFSFAEALFIDLDRQKHIAFQQLSAPLSMIYAVKMIFAIGMTWCLTAPVLLISKALMGGALYTVDTQWGLFYGVVLLASCMLCTYAFMCICMVNSLRGIGVIRTRVNEVLQWFGGFVAPWYIMNKSGAGWGFITKFGPYLYVTEALRQVIIPGSEFFPLWVSNSMLLLWTLIFYFIGYRFFVKKCR